MENSSFKKSKKELVNAIAEYLYNQKNDLTIVDFVIPIIFIGALIFLLLL
jgi:hypothetical protein